MVKKVSSSPLLEKLNVKLASESRWFRRLSRGVWIIFLCIILGGPAYIISVSVNLFGLFGDMPSLKAVENPTNDLSSDLISADGVSLARYFTFNRSQVTFKDLSPELVSTLVISEDHRFYDHSGLDFQAFLRVFKGLITFDISGHGGGSTITQQLAKNLFTINPELDGSIGDMGGMPRRIIQKTKEWMIAIKLERNFTKQEIIAMYLNTCSFSHNAYGIKVASETYFGKKPALLNLQESAVLVGMLQNPSLFNPHSRPKNALSKRNEVITKLYRSGYIKSKSSYDSLMMLPIKLNFSVQDQNDGIAPYLRSALQSELMKWCREHGYNLWESGLKIYTTIDSRMQRYAMEAVEESMSSQQRIFDDHWKGRNPWINESGEEIEGFLESRIKQSDVYRRLVAKYGSGSDSITIILNEKRPMTVFSWKGERDTLFSYIDSLNYYKRFLHAGFMSMDPQTGEVKAWVGGINYKYFMFDHVRQGSRQPGSTFKPIVYGTAMEAGFNPCLKLPDISPTFKLSNGKTWTPPNSGGDMGTGEQLTLRQALAQSKNTITAQVLKLVGVDNVISFAKRVGITSKLAPVPALCLGVSNVSVYELVGSYSAFVNQGAHTKPFYITRIEDKHGNVIQNFVPETKQAISEQTAFKMVYMLMGGVEEAGGSSRLLNSELREDNEIGGKTGTSNDASDGWYMGITHDLVSGAWVGGDERGIRFRQWSLGQGGKTALPIWDKFMLKVYNDRSLKYKKGSFRRPSTLDISLDCREYVDPETSLTLAPDNWNPNN